MLQLEEEEQKTSGKNESSNSTNPTNSIYSDEIKKNDPNESRPNLSIDDKEFLGKKRESELIKELDSIKNDHKKKKKFK